LQCVAVCCSVLQCVAVCCSVLQCVAVWCSVLQCVAVCCSVYHNTNVLNNASHRQRMAATDSIYGCNRLYILLQVTLYLAATAIAYAVAVAIDTIQLQLNLYMPATDSVYRCNCHNVCMGCCNTHDTAATHSIFGCNRLYIWLQLPLRVQVLLQYTRYSCNFLLHMAATDSIYGCN